MAVTALNLSLTASRSEVSRPRSWPGGFWGGFLLHSRLESSLEPQGSLARSGVAKNPPRAGLAFPTCNAWTGHRGSAMEQPQGGLASTQQCPRRNQMDQGPLPGLGAACPSPQALLSSGEARWPGHCFWPQVWAGLGPGSLPQRQPCSGCAVPHRWGGGGDHRSPCPCVTGGNKRPGARRTCPPVT